MSAIPLTRNPFGKLVFTSDDGETHEGVIPVRAFPILAPEDGIALVSADGRELLWLDRLADIDGAARTLISEELATREFVPEITRIRAISSFACPSVWSIDTDRGPTDLVLNGEEDIRRIGSRMLLIADKHGIQYLLRDLTALDKMSRKHIDRFL